ncbi:hypothetical protein ACUN0C_12385 [Faunimonas sp. B44]|uniref:hypothetical protein n=1 Tax=Faunimonas sp. B44 TaxID=3461493 RepID=UPI004043B27F
MHASFGIETASGSTRWADVLRGPSRAEVLAHVRKLANYPALMAGVAPSAEIVAFRRNEGVRGPLPAPVAGRKVA